MAAPIPTKCFRDLALAVAIDSSGSTYGRTLAAEITVIRQILSLLPPNVQVQTPILPWSDAAEGIWSSQGLEQLTSGGGTDPSSLYYSSTCVNALKSSELWFLLTDGQIEERLVETFATNTAGLGLHNRGCVVIVFGSTMRGRPAECDISVGKAAYALTPDCLFLFHDIATSRLSIMQAKGCFRSLLSRHGRTVPNPSLNHYTSWGDLPHISYEDLASVDLSLRQSVGKEEMILENNTVLNVQELYAGSVNEETIEALLRNQDNLKSLVLAEMARGRGKELQDWLDTQQTEVPELTTDRPDADGAAQEAVNQLLAIWNDPACAEERSVLQAKLRAAHSKNRKIFDGTVKEFRKRESAQHRRNSYFEAARRQSMTYSQPEPNPRRATSSSYGHRRSSGMMFSAGWDDVDAAEDDRGPTRPIPTREDTIKPTSTKVFFPGFKRSSPLQQECRGQCMFCGEISLMTLLLTAETEEDRTENFPRRFSATLLTFPLAMSSFDETVILSFFVSCDACAFYLVRNFTSPLGERLASALPLTDVKANEAIWLDTLDKAFKGRFIHHCVFQVFLGTLDNRIQANRLQEGCADEKALFHKAATWAQEELTKLATTAPLLSPAFQQGKVKKKNHKTLSILLEDEAFLDPALPTNAEIAMLRYPITGFSVIVRLLVIRNTSKPKVQRYIFLRLLFEVVEVFMARRREVGHDQADLEWRQKLDALSTTGVQNTAVASKPAKLLPDLGLVQHDIYAELKMLRDEWEKTEWYLHGVRTFVEKLVEVDNSVHDAVTAFNALKVRPDLVDILQHKDERRFDYR